MGRSEPWRKPREAGDRHKTKSSQTGGWDDRLGERTACEWVMVAQQSPPALVSQCQSEGKLRGRVGSQVPRRKAEHKVIRFRAATHTRLSCLAVSRAQRHSGTVSPYPIISADWAWDRCLRAFLEEELESWRERAWVTGLRWGPSDRS